MFLQILWPYGPFRFYLLQASLGLNAFLSQDHFTRKGKGINHNAYLDNVPQSNPNSCENKSMIFAIFEAGHSFLSK